MFLIGLTIFASLLFPGFCVPENDYKCLSATPARSDHFPKFFNFWNKQVGDRYYEESNEKLASKIDLVAILRLFVCQQTSAYPGAEQYIALCATYYNDKAFYASQNVELLKKRINNKTSGFLDGLGTRQKAFTNFLCIYVEANGDSDALSLPIFGMQYAGYSIGLHEVGGYRFLICSSNNCNTKEAFEAEENKMVKSKANDSSESRQLMNATRANIEEPSVTTSTILPESSVVTTKPIPINESTSATTTNIEETSAATSTVLEEIFVLTTKTIAADELTSSTTDLSTSSLKEVEFNRAIESTTGAHDWTISISSSNTIDDFELPSSKNRTKSNISTETLFGNVSSSLQNDTKFLTQSSISDNETITDSRNKTGFNSERSSASDPTRSGMAKNIGMIVGACVACIAVLMLIILLGVVINANRYSGRYRVKEDGRIPSESEV